MKRKYDINETWIGYELHPETPLEGVLISERFKGYDVSQMYENLRRHGKEFGIVFADRAVLSNSRLSLQAGEYARDMGRYEQFHERIFYAYFTEAIDIGNVGKICDIAGECGLNPVEMMHAIKTGCYQLRLDHAKKEGMKIQLTGVPTFVINEKYNIFGAQSEKVFTDLLDRISSTQD